MPTNRPSEDRYGSAFQEQASKEAIQKYNREKNKRRARVSIPIPTAEDLEYLGSEQSQKDRRTVIEKLTAPPETVIEHLDRIGCAYSIEAGLCHILIDTDELARAEGRK